MKRAYSKPQIVFDSFELSQNIAGNCEFIPLDNQAEFSCQVYVKEWGKDYTYFADTNSCWSAMGPGENDTLCYHAPTDAGNVFNS